MIVRALYTFAGVLDLSAMERLQEGNPCEAYPFRLYIRPGEVVEADDKFYTLRRIQDALRLGYIEISGLANNNNWDTNLADMTYVGVTMGQTVGEDVVMGDLVYYRDDGKLYKTKADTSTTMICVGMSTGTYTVNTKATILVEGLMRNSARFSFVTGGQADKTKSLVFVSDSVWGQADQTRPNVSKHLVQLIGYALSTDILSFKPDHTYVELA